MKSKMLKKIISCMIAGAMVTGMLAGCGSTDKPAASEETKKSEAAQESKTESSAAAEESAEESKGITYPLEGNVKFTYAYDNATEMVLSAIAEDLAATPFGEHLMLETGVEFTCVEVADEAAMNLLFAGGDLPDIVQFNFGKYPGGAEKAVKDGIIQPITDYMEFAPDFQEALSNNPEYEQAAKTSTGEIIGFSRILESTYNRTSAGIIARNDWLEELGLEEPRTPEELYNVLKTFKEKKGAESPLCVGEWWLREIGINHGLFTSAFGMAKGAYYQEDGKVHWGVTEPEYKDVLAWLNKLYEEGLLEKNFQTIDQNTINANMMNGVAGVTFGSCGGNLGLYMQTMRETDPNTTYEVIGIQPLVAKEGDRPMSTHFSDAVGTTFIAITTACEDVEAAVKFLNYGYTEAGRRLYNFGVEGESYTMVDGQPVYTDFVLNNPNGESIKYAVGYHTRSSAEGAYLYDQNAYIQTTTDPLQLDAMNKWTDTDAIDYYVPAAPIAEEYLAEYTALESDINTYVSEMTLKYITGMESLDTFESEYLATLKKMNVDRVIEIKQAALDAFMAR